MGKIFHTLRPVWAVLALPGRFILSFFFVLFCFPYLTLQVTILDRKQGQGFVLIDYYCCCCNCYFLISVREGRNFEA